MSALAGALCPPRRACLLSPNLSPTWLCLSPWLGCCVRLAGLVSGLVSQFVSQFPSDLNLSLTFPSGFVSQFSLPICFPSGFVFHLGWVLFPPRWACLRSCLPICLPPGFVFRLGWGAVSASLGLSPNLLPNLSPIWLCLSFFSPFVPHLALSFTLAGVLCPNLFPNLSPTSFVFHLGWGAVCYY